MELVTKLDFSIRAWRLPERGAGFHLYAHSADGALIWNSIGEGYSTLDEARTAARAFAPELARDMADSDACAICGGADGLLIKGVAGRGAHRVCMMPYQ